MGTGDGGQPSIKPVNTISNKNIIGFVVSGVIAFVVLVVVICFCLKKRRGHKKFNDRPLALRRPTAVRNPTAHSHYLKKSPSPTGIKSPPGLSRSPCGGQILSSDSKYTRNISPKSISPNDDSDHRQFSTLNFENERDKPTTPSKEELEFNQKNLNKDATAGKLGRLYFKLRYNAEKSAFIVTVIRCTGLPTKDQTTGSCDPYVKLQLLPEKQHKAKTRVLRNTCNPQYDEDFTFYGIPFAQLQGMTMHFVIVSFDRYSRDEIIGEVVSPIAQLDLPNTESSLSLARDITPRSVKGRGELLVSLCYQPAATRLTVVILKARNLPKMDVVGLSDPYVKIYLLSKGQRIAKKKTHVKKRTLNPVFNESFVFDLPEGAKDLSDISLEFLLLDWDRVTKNEVIGCLEMGGQSSGSALHHWEEVVTSPRRQIAEWHKLKE